MFVTPLYAGILAIWFIVLSARVVNLRRRGIIFGDNGDVGVIRIVRAHANFAEYVPLALLLMGFLEVSRFSIYLLHALGLTLLVARLIHGLALSYGWQMRFGRVAGSALTFIVLLIEAALCLYQGLRGQWVWFQ
ncbi:MAG: MAPEG family protein [Pseudomonadota bacterium]|nr:MAPEG family protein [Pseudomonadota bacterium]